MMSSTTTTTTKSSADSASSAAVAAQALKDIQIVDAITNSWKQIQNIPNYDLIVGVKLFRKIFELAPNILSLYPFGAENAFGNALYGSDVFQRHAKGVVKMLEAVVKMIIIGPNADNNNNNNMEPAIKTLHQLGARHVSYGVRTAHYGVVGKALLYTLETALVPHGLWTPIVQKGWKSLYTFVSLSMIEGAEQQQQQQPHTSATKRFVVAAAAPTTTKKHSTTSSNKSKATWKRKDTTTATSSKEMKQKNRKGLFGSIKQSWLAIRAY